MTAIPIDERTRRPTDEARQQRVHSTTGIERYIQRFDESRNSLPGHGLSWLAEMRQRAMAAFSAFGVPNTKHESWKYTNVSPIMKEDFAPASLPQQLPEQADAGLLQDAKLGGIQLHFVNGLYVEASSTAADLPQGVWVQSLARAVAEDPSWVEAHLGRLAAAEKHPFRALNEASWQDGAVIRIDDGVELSQPIHLLLQNTQSEDPWVAHPRVLVVAGQSSKAVVVEHYVGGEEKYFTNSIVEMSAAANARLDYFKVQQESPQAFHLSSVCAEAGRDSTINLFSMALGGKIARTEMDVTLQAAGAHCGMYGLYWGRGSQLVDHTTTIEHAEPHCSSDEVFRGIMDGSSRGVFSGTIVVAEHAQKTDANQSNKNLLLSRKAHVDTKPQLEVYADDVKCAHGATVGQLDEKALFYLRQRGIDETQAKALLTYGFASELLERIDLEPLRNALEEWLQTGVLLTD